MIPIQRFEPHTLFEWNGPDQVGAFLIAIGLVLGEKDAFLGIASLFIGGLVLVSNWAFQLYGERIPEGIKRRLTLETAMGASIGVIIVAQILCAITRKDQWIVLAIGYMVATCIPKIYRDIVAGRAGR